MDAWRSIAGSYPIRKYHTETESNHPQAIQQVRRPILTLNFSTNSFPHTYLTYWARILIFTCLPNFPDPMLYSRITLKDFVTFWRARCLEAIFHTRISICATKIWSSALNTCFPTSTLALLRNQYVHINALHKVTTFHTSILVRQIIPSTFHTLKILNLKDLIGKLLEVSSA